MSDGKLTGIKNWSEEDRPREKLLLKGARSLSAAELLAILIGSGNTQESAVELCKRIMADVDHNLNQLATLDIADLTKYKGIGEAKAISIVAAIELSRRRAMATPVRHPLVATAQDIYDLVGPMLADLPHEEMWLLIMNTRQHCIKKIRIGVGGTRAVFVDQRIIWKHAIENLAATIALVHNHPSGNPVPSTADKTLTKKLVQAGQLLEIKVVDHVIIAHNRYYSFSEAGAIV